MTNQIQLSRINAETMLVPIKGISPLIVHRFSEKAKKLMLDGFQGKKAPKEPKNPQAEYERALYRLPRPDGTEAYGFPALGFKAATVGGARFYRTVKMTEIRQFVFMTGEFSPIDGQQLVEIHGEPVMREDITKVGIKQTDLRYRPMFPQWHATLTVTFAKDCISRDAVLNLIDAGGMGVGVGEWRPERNGEFGTFQIDLDKEIEVNP